MNSLTRCVHNNKKRHDIEIYQDILKGLVTIGSNEEGDDNNTDSLSIMNLMCVAKITNSHTFYKKLKPLLNNGYIYSPTLKRYKVTEKGKEYLKALDKVLLPYHEQTSQSSNKR